MESLLQDDDISTVVDEINPNLLCSEPPSLCEEPAPARTPTRTLTRTAEERFVETVKRYRCLWDSGSPDYKDR